MSKTEVINVLKKRLDEAFDNVFHNNASKRMGEAIEAIQELVPPDCFEMDDGWISVEDALPENPQSCIVYYAEEHAATKGSWDGRNWKILFGDGWSWESPLSYVVTHWRNLPSPPNS